jgi:hypothetical protein
LTPDSCARVWTRHASPHPAHATPPTPAGFDDDGARADDSLPLQRKLPAEQAANDLAAVRRMWQMAAVLRLLAAFKQHLGLSQLFSAAELEEALVSSPGDEGLLPQLHTDLLSGPSSAGRSAQLAQGKWAAALRGRLEAAGIDAPDLRRNGKGREAMTYAALPAPER